MLYTLINNCSSSKKMSKKLFVKTYGCQMNVYDSLRMQDLLDPFGYKTTDEMESADMIILNTCHIREKASEKLYSELGRIKKIKDARIKENSSPMIIAVAGCVAQGEGDEIFARAPYVDIVVGPQSYHTLPELLAKIARKEKHVIELDFIEEAKFDVLPQTVSNHGYSAFVSIQEGCNKFCTFCVVPYTRGAEFSRNVEQVYNEALAAALGGAKEIYLLGQNVNAYHGKTQTGENSNLANLISYIATIPAVERIRYITSHPIDMSGDLIAMHGTEQKLMPFLHLPVQSGSNKILKAMNRKHTREYYFEVIEKLRSARSDIVFSSDFIVGFPGETDEDFADTVDLVQRVRYGQCYSFKYSPRPGTPAAIKEQIPEHIKDERLSILQQELSKQQLEFNLSCVGKTMEVLFANNGKFDHQIVGKTPYMQSVYITNPDASLLGQVCGVKINSASMTSLSGELVPISSAS
jgi:tRNA-2-methylthio-N6-dimethylallyladenosine synthase